MGLNWGEERGIMENRNKTEQEQSGTIRWYSGRKLRRPFRNTQFYPLVQIILSQYVVQ